MPNSVMALVLSKLVFILGKWPRPSFGRTKIRIIAKSFLLGSSQGQRNQDTKVVDKGKKSALQGCTRTWGDVLSRKQWLHPKHKHHKVTACPLPGIAFLMNRSTSSHQGTEVKSCMSVCWGPMESVQRLLADLGRLRPEGSTPQPLLLDPVLPQQLLHPLWAVAVVLSEGYLLNIPQSPYTNHLEKRLPPSLLYITKQQVLEKYCCVHGSASE